MVTARPDPSNRSFKRIGLAKDRLIDWRTSKALCSICVVKWKRSVILLSQPPSVVLMFPFSRILLRIAHVSPCQVTGPTLTTQ